MYLTKELYRILEIVLKVICLVKEPYHTIPTVTFKTTCAVDLNKYTVFILSYHSIKSLLVGMKGFPFIAWRENPSDPSLLYGTQYSQYAYKMSEHAT
jgi:hypothetical protein